MTKFARLLLPLLVCCGLFLAIPGMSAAESPPPPPAPFPPPAPVPPDMQQAKQPALQLVAPGVFALGDIRINKGKNSVEFPAKVNMQEGLIEYILVGGAGKLHESLLKTDVEPYSLQVALLLTGLEGTLDPLAAQGEQKKPTGDRVSITVKWQESGKEQQVPVEQWVRKGLADAGPIPWTFTGSIVHDGVFFAQAQKSIIAIYHDPAAMIDHELLEGANDEMWFVQGAKTPAVDTDVTVIIQKK